MRLNRVDKDTMKNVGVSKECEEWFLRNVGEMRLEALHAIIGDYLGYVGELKAMFPVIVIDRIEIYVEPNGIVTTLTFDENDDCINRRDNDGFEQRFTYDDKHNELIIKSSNGFIEKKEYDSFGNCVKITGNIGGDVFLEYDERKNLTKTIYADGRIEEKVYDDNDNLLIETFTHHTATDIKHVKTYNYSKSDKLLSISNEGSGLDEGFWYDSKDRLIKYCNSAGIWWKREYSGADVSRHEDMTGVVNYAHYNDDYYYVVKANGVEILRIPLL